MNICFLKGKIVNDIEFNFILNSYNISVVIFKIELENKNIITMKGYNEIADYCYRNLSKNSVIAIYGELTTKGEINIIEFDIL